MHTSLLLWLCCASTSYCATQDIITILQQHSDLSTFVDLLESSPDLVDTVNEGAFTVFAPTNEAFAAFTATNPSRANDTDYMHALLHYHIIEKTYASAEFELTPPLFPNSLLTSQEYVNITGGQRVHLSTLETQPTVFSGLKSPSRLIESDIFYRAGFIHIIDAVLTIPVSIAATVTGAKLNNLAAILNIGGWLTPDSDAKKILNDRSDLTVFAPDDPRYGATFSGFDGLSDKALEAIFQYSFIQESAPLYSSALKNGTSYSTLAPGIRMLYTEVNGQSYVDSARITVTNYLVSNGVLHITDAPMNPEKSGIGPVIDMPVAVTGSDDGLSPGVRAGLGVGITAIVLLLLLAAAVIIRRRRGLRLIEKPFTLGRKGHRLPDQETAAGVSKPETKHGYRFDKAELPGSEPPSYPIQELEGKHYIKPPTTRLPHGKSASVVEILDLAELQRNNLNETTTSHGGSVQGCGSDGSLISPENSTTHKIDRSEKSTRSRINGSIAGNGPRHIAFHARR